MSLPDPQGMRKERAGKASPGALCLTEAVGLMLDGCWGNGGGVDGLQVQRLLRSLWL